MLRQVHHKDHNDLNSVTMVVVQCLNYNLGHHNNIYHSLQRKSNFNGGDHALKLSTIFSSKKADSGNVNDKTRSTDVSIIIILCTRLVGMQYVVRGLLITDAATVVAGRGRDEIKESGDDYGILFMSSPSLC